MSPTEQEIKFFTSQEAKRIQELWEPKFGDWAITNTNHLVIINGLDRLAPPDGKETYGVVHASDMDYFWHKWKSNLIWLPRQGQLQEMLEEATGREEGQIGLEGPYPTPETRYGVNISSETGYIYHEGPTPSIALGKCLLEVLKEE